MMITKLEDLLEEVPVQKKKLLCPAEDIINAVNDVFVNKSLPKYYALTKAIYPELDTLNEDTRLYSKGWFISCSIGASNIYSRKIDYYFWSIDRHYSFNNDYGKKPIYCYIWCLCKNTC